MGKQRKTRSQKNQADKKTKKIIKNVSTKESNVVDRQFMLMKHNNKRTIKIQFPYINIPNSGKKIAYSILNKDKLYYTPTFILADEKNTYQQKQNLKMHKDRVSVEENHIEAKEIQIPKPSVRNSYCTICKTRFQDYLAHIRLQQHQFKMKMSQYNQHIKELCQQYPASQLIQKKKSEQMISMKAEESTDFVSANNPFDESVLSNKQPFKLEQGQDVKEKLYLNLKGYQKPAEQNAESLFNVLA